MVAKNLKKSAKRIWMVFVICLLLAAGVIWYLVPVSMPNVNVDEVKSIEIFDGNSGNSVTITDEEKVQYLIKNFNTLKLKKNRLSFGYMGYRFRVTIQPKSGKKIHGWDTFIVNSSDSVRKDPFFYRTTDTEIDCAYIEQLIEEEQRTTALCRIVTGAEDGHLLLAAKDSPSDVYRLDIGDIPVVYEDEERNGVMENGMMVEISYSGETMECYPEQFMDVDEIRVLSDEIDDMCTLYLEVLNDLWEVDPGLNDDISELGIDLSKTRLSEAEKAAVAWAFGEQHGLETIQGTHDELIAQGYIDKDLLMWKNGCLFSISEKESGKSVIFNAEKWRSGDGAYFFDNCIATQHEDGKWDYTIGAEAIS